MPPILIIHGWSDNYLSFEPLKNWLSNHGHVATDVFLGNYATMRDAVTFDDLAVGLQNRIEEMKTALSQQFSLAPFSLDLIVHSTGGPVVRHWLNYYLNDVCNGDLEKCPVRSIIMLAPANFGSRLAAQGKSALAKLFKGGVANGFQTGANILDGLELGSPALWRMAHRDLFASRSIYPCVPEKGPFVYIFSGTGTYGDLKGLVAVGANEDGSDGTIRASSASMDSVKITASYTGAKPDVQAIRQQNSPYAFRLVPGVNHSEIVPRDANDDQHPMYPLILKCLAINTSAAYRDLSQVFDDFNQEFYKQQSSAPEGAKVGAYQQFIMHVVDELNNDVEDYQINLNVIDDSIHQSVWLGHRENLESLKIYQKESETLQTQVITNVQAHSKNPSYRTFFVNMDRLDNLQKTLDQDSRKPFIAMNLDAVGPDVDLRYDTDSLQYINVRWPVNDAAGRKVEFFKRNTSTLIEIQINRVPGKPIFEILP